MLVVVFKHVGWGLFIVNEIVGSSLQFCATENIYLRHTKAMLSSSFRDGYFLLTLIQTVKRRYDKESNMLSGKPHRP